MNKNKSITLCAAIVVAGGICIGYNSGKPELKDGVYRVYSETYIENGYKPFAEIEVKNGRMIDAFLDYINEDGELLTKNKELKAKYYNEFNNFPEGFTKEIRAELLIKQSTDTLSKASSYENGVKTFKKMVDELIEKRIKKGKEESLTVKL